MKTGATPHALSHGGFVRQRFLVGPAYGHVPASGAPAPSGRSRLRTVAGLRRHEGRAPHPFS